MITIELLSAVTTTDDTGTRWVCEIAATDSADGQRWLATWAVYNLIPYDGLQAALDADAANIWAFASTNGQLDDVFYDETAEDLARAMAVVIYGQIATFRAALSLPEITWVQFQQSIYDAIHPDV